MALMDLHGDHGGDRAPPGALALTLYGCLYWFLFVLVLVLEPDNALRAWQAGHPLSFGREALRIAAAAVIGAAATPVPLALTGRFPLTGDRVPRNALIHIVGAAFLAFALVVVGCVAAAAGFESRLPTLGEIRAELTANWTLLVFAVGGFTVIIQLLRLDRRRAPERSRDMLDRSGRILVGSGARRRFLEAGEVDWIESQGNYLALHVGAQVHLIRRTLKDLEAQLDSARFVRIHRGSIVAIDRIREMEPLTNGDAVLTLSDGRRLRVSRSYREDVHRRSFGA
jgi:hypothetical protein